MELNPSTNTSSLKSVIEEKIIVHLIEVYNSEEVILKKKAENEKNEVENNFERAKRFENNSPPPA